MNYLNDLVSVIIPIYNKERYLRKCVKSIIEQTYSNIEIILVNDGSYDDSLKICNELGKYDDRIVIFDKKNRGVSSARNAGLELAKGQYITFVDADDWIENNLIEDLLYEIKRSKADIACGYFSYDEGNETVKSVLGKECYEKITILTQIEVCEEITKIYNRKLGWENCSKLFSKEVIDNIFYDENITNGEDWLFFCKALVRTKKIVCLPIFSYHYVFFENSASNFCRASYITASKASEIVLSLDLPFSKNATENIYESIAQNAAFCLKNWHKQNSDFNKEIIVAKRYVSKYKKYVYLNKEAKIKRKIKFLLYSKFYKFQRR